MAARIRSSVPLKILFIGNSFTFGAGSAVRFYRPDTVTDLNNLGIGGVPALFKSFTQQAGLDYDVYLETEPGSDALLDAAEARWFAVPSDGGEVGWEDEFAFDEGGEEDGSKVRRLARELEDDDGRRHGVRRPEIGRAHV